MGGDVDLVEVFQPGGVGVGAHILEDGLEDVGAIGDDAIDVQGKQCMHLVGIVDGPGDDLEASLVKRRDVHCGRRAEHSRIDGGEDRRGFSAMGRGMAAGGDHQFEEAILRGLLGDCKGGQKQAGGEYKAVRSSHKE